ncbi:MAG: M20/M25/M40 family metallo-hydrolase [Candidatus Lokiarchaeota archaeon]|nr:M20/M25/M40 family metallo-hydrolase [Candidatus Lokiarchaeota archaeon]
MEKDFLKKLISIESISGNENKIIEYIKNFFERNKIRANIDSVGNIIAEIGSGSNCLIFSSHVDTVPDFLKVQEKNGKIFGRGAVDDKSTTAAMILSFLKFKESNLNKRIKYIGIVEEEISLKGMQPFISEKIKADAAIFGEPTNNMVSIAYKGRLLYEVSLINLKGPQHPANISDYENPILLTFQIWNEIEKFFSDNYRGKTPFFSVIPNLTVINTNNNSNIIPDKCNFSIDIRIPPSISLEELNQKITVIFKKYKESYPINIKFKLLSKIPGYRIDKNEKIVKISQEAVKSILDVEPKLIRKTGTNFMNIFGEILGIPTVSIGPGNPKLEHTKEESIDIQEYEKAIKIFEKIIELYLTS